MADLSMPAYPGDSDPDKEEALRHTGASRFQMTDRDRYRVTQARAELDALETLDLGDDRAMARALGRIEVALQQLVEMVDEAVAE
ncbi:hypothetical protein CW362_16445 [Streptomyces populi]|uniref:Sulfatase n=1 Tax=Streptomyces populi TaxID=2058924 RepID=A0A2I0SPM3_9ACTN|nr:hypothetical protein [Streptomyces populi]PKT71850.1 hypothetical protein CW362_16445 [Streptomyces populi]